MENKSTTLEHKLFEIASIFYTLASGKMEIQERNVCKYDQIEVIRKLLTYLNSALSSAHMQLLSR